MYNTNLLYNVTGHVAEIQSPNKAIIHFELHGVLQAAFLKSHRFYKDGKRLSDNNQNLNQVLKVGHKVGFSCHINDNSEHGQCRWFITNCWRKIESEHKVVMSSGMMNVTGTVTELKQRHGTLTMTDLMECEYRILFLASKVYLYGKRLSASKPLSSQLQLDDKLYFDAIPCFPEENNHYCNWFATCVHKGKKPEMYLHKELSIKMEMMDSDKERMLNQYIESIKLEDESIREKSPVSHADILINGLNTNAAEFSPNSDFSPTHSQQQASGYDSTIVERQTSKAPSISETELAKENTYHRIEPNQLNAQMLNDIQLLTNDPRVVFAKSEGIILDVINEEYGVILGEFQRNVFQSILFHRKNAFLFKMNLADSKLTEIFIEGDRVRFIAVDAPEKFICDWIATQVSVAYDREDEDDDLDDDISEDHTE